jgi:hypothetical protein
VSSEIAERLEILRRIGERGLRLAQTGSAADTAYGTAHAKHLDLWQHLLDELKRVPSGDSAP